MGVLMRWALVGVLVGVCALARAAGGDGQTWTAGGSFVLPGAYSTHGTLLIEGERYESDPPTNVYFTWVPSAGNESKTFRANTGGLGTVQPNVRTPCPAVWVSAVAGGSNGLLRINPGSVGTNSGGYVAATAQTFPFGSPTGGSGGGGGSDSPLTAAEFVSSASGQLVLTLLKLTVGIGLFLVVHLGVLAAERWLRRTGRI